jgi:hypothetical protein
VHVEGTFTASASTLTLRSADVSSQAQSLMGRYTYAADSQGLTLTKDGRTHVLAKEGAKKLCGGFAARPCDSGFACVDDPNDACDPQNGGADCGGICVPASGQVTTPGASVLVPEVTKIVVENAGGGFVPPPPAGSACALGAAKYTLDLKSGRLDWAVCNSKDMSKPYMLDTGSRVLAEDELAKVASELAVVKVGNTDLCGADKPFETVTVTTPAGSFQYLDTFYGCQQPEKIHVNGIDEALDALRKLAVDCRTLGCDAGKSCQLCWTQFACVPEGALC